ncbi:N-acetylmuramoyl-L-alanine amidase [Paracoccus ravus]|uniref:N-acetylmuramoyl-L-alanine amidase n=1 Tax=Paracoccus ravus TaxID=2447760 RepID=UPI00106DFAE7|nr:N-acetylmuramoyl-L-alanine amidase [Paracoccus ravus]
MSLSPNHGDRRGQKPELVVLHYTGMVDGPSARARLCDPASEVSAHWLIHEDGLTEALVPEDRRAWHAGAGSWQGRTDVNSRSIGIELVNPGDRPFPEPQMKALEVLLRGVMLRWGISADAVIAHSDMAPDRKIDPGPRFDWKRLALQGLALWPGEGADLPLGASLARIGYPESPAALSAFRLRFRPWGKGEEHPEDRRLAAALAYRPE